MPGFKSFVEGFFDADEELALCQIVGHSYDLDVYDMWDYMEWYLCRISEDPEILSMTNGELVRYLNAMNSVEMEDGYIKNHSDQRLWFDVDGEILSLVPGEIYIFDEE